jgi:two-component system, OmpR family, response regulator ChvI
MVEDGERKLGYRVLLVDDEPSITQTFELGLKHYGFEVDSFNNPVSALAAYSPSKYDILLFDIRMPIMNGFELYKEIRKIDDQAKVCFITAYEIDDDFKKSFPTMTLRHFIKKPIQLETLARELQNKINGNYQVIE